MTVEPDTSSDLVETVSDEPSESDTPEDFDFYDPDDEQDTGEAEETEGTDDETVEAEADDEAAGQETEETDAEPTLALDDGTEIPLSEAKKGYLRQADYSLKTQKLANDRKQVEADAQRISSVTEAVVEHLARMMPPEPNAALAQTDPAAYTRQKAMYEAAEAQLAKIIESGKAAKSVTEEMSDADRAARANAEGEKLAAMFPEVATDKAPEFFKGARSVALELGFTPEELGEVNDHRMVAVLHWARKGMDAEKAKAQAKAKAQKAPPAAPRKPGQGVARGNTGNKAAMRKLRETGSFEAAMQVDFD